jgi:transposase
MSRGAVAETAVDVAATVARLEAEVTRLATALDAMTAERDRYRHLYERLREAYAKLEHGLRGQLAERLPADDRQLTLGILGTLLGTDAAAAPPAQPVRAHERRSPSGRKPLPAHLPRVRIELVPLDVQQDGLDQYERIGAEVSEVVERRPASTVVVELIRPKYVRKDRERVGPTRVLIAEPAELPIPRGRAGPGLLADTIVRRWQDHQPLHRLEGIYARDGLGLNRSTLCGWHEQLATLVRPVADAMLADALRQPLLCTDATGVLVQARDRCRTGHFWVLVAPERHVLFRYSRRHDSAAVDALLAGYQGYLVADAHSVYDHLFVDGRVTEVACWAHARRYFFKTLGSEPERAREALALIGELFRIEREIATAPRAHREAVRQAQSRRVVDAFFAWCAERAADALPETPLAAALTYATNQREALARFLADGRLPLHNNRSELELRRQVVGRKNWLFVGSDDAATVNTTFVSLLASCALHRLEPWTYLRDILCLLPGWPQRRVLDLAPAYWAQTSEQQDTQERLAANPFRVALQALDRHPDDDA